VLEAERLSGTEMQSIALEMNLSETAFVLDSEVADFRFRYFTPAAEIPLAGHPTIATVTALVNEGIVPMRGEAVSLTIELAAGVIRVDVYPGPEVLPVIVMTQLKPAFGRRYDPATVMRVFGLETEDLLNGAVVQTVSTGTPQLMVPVRGHEALARSRMDAALYRALKASGDFFSPHLFCLGGFTEVGDTAARHYGVPPDTAEDPFTGSATGGMAAFLWHYGLIEDRRFVAEQGHPMGRPGRAEVEVLGPREEPEAVRVGGTAVELLRGDLTLP
jgi:trans-2,3-dihydro-3-hydroxyanthranilate isomerase